MEFRASTADEIEKIGTLMQESFHVSGEDPMLNRSYLHWKYFEPGPPWPGSRSYVLTAHNTIVAHAAIWPVQLCLKSGMRHGISFGDWAADEKHRGAGLLLLRHLRELASFVLVTGGAPVTRKILPRAGFQPWADRLRFARVLRPVQQAAVRPWSLGAREPLRLLRNIAWSFRRTAPVVSWVAEAGVPDDRISRFAAARLGSVPTVEFLKFMVRCPTAAVHFLWLRQGTFIRGYSVLSIIGDQARLGDLRIDSGDQEDWNAAVSALVRFAKDTTKACEIVGTGSVANIDGALVANGFVPRGSTPLVVSDAKVELPRDPVVQLGMLEDDALVLPETGFLT